MRSEPGSCPICGMALEPRTLTAEEPDNPELRDMTRRFWVSTILSAPLFLLTMGTMLAGHEAAAWLPPRVLAWIELALATLFPGVFPDSLRGVPHGTLREGQETPMASHLEALCRMCAYSGRS